MRVHVSASAALLALFAVSGLGGCGRVIGPYDNPYEYTEGDWGESSTTRGLVQGDAGNFVDFRSEASFTRWTYGDAADVEVGYSGDVPVDNGSVLVDVMITGEERMPIGTPMHFPPGVYGIGGVWLDVYVCPNGNGASGPADEVVITKLEDGTITVMATAQDPEQNLDLDVTIEGPPPFAEPARPLLNAKANAQGP